MECEIKWIADTGISFTAQTGSGHVIEIDTLKGDIKNAIGPRPMEIFLVGAVSCTLYDLVDGIKAEGGTLHSCKAVAQGKRRDVKPKIFSEIRVNFIISGEKISHLMVADILKTSKEINGSAMRMLEATASIFFDFEITVDNG